MHCTHHIQTCDAFAIWALVNVLYNGIAPVHEGYLLSLLQKGKVLLLQPYVLHKDATRSLIDAIICLFTCFLFSYFQCTFFSLDIHVS